MEDVLAKIPLLAGLKPEDRTTLAGLMQTVRFETQKPIIWIGEQGTDFYVVQHGAVAVVAPDETGKEVTLAQLGPGAFFGELSLLDGGPRTASVRSIADTTLLCLGRGPFLRFLHDHPAAAIHMLQVLGQRQREMVEKVPGIRNVNEVIAETRTQWHELAHRIAEISASKVFIVMNIIFFGVWVTINALSDRWAFDPKPFDILSFIIGIEGMFISLFVLISQNQEGERERVRAELDYQVNLKAHMEVMQLHQKVDRLQQAVIKSLNGDGAKTGV